MDKIGLYKNNLIEYENKEKSKNILIKQYDFDDVDYIIGILFLTQMNMYCKLSNFTAHGYYIAYSFMVMFNEINFALKNDNKLEINVITYFWLSLTNNIVYLKEKIDNSPTINKRTKINIINNLSKFINEISIITNNIANINIKNDENQYKLFFYMLLITAKYFGSGEYKDHNVERLSEYYSNIFLIHNKSKNIKPGNNNIELFDMFMINQTKIHTSLFELGLNSNTLDEIINYINIKITENISI